MHQLGDEVLPVLGMPTDLHAVLYYRSVPDLRGGVYSWDYLEWVVLISRNDDQTNRVGRQRCVRGLDNKGFVDL